MWQRVMRFLVCPLCKGPVELSIFTQMTATIFDEDAAFSRRKGLSDNDFGQFVESGLVLCHHCKKWFPITRGLPVLLPYTTPLHNLFVVDFKDEISQLKLNYEFPCLEPVHGERLVMASFSKEWWDYHYDGVLWDESYHDLEETFEREVNLDAIPGEGLTFLEIGCGLGVTTYIAHKRYKVDAIGVDLSLASMRASQHYRSNPFLHFVQASAFYLPFREGSFGVVYSRGVLHHTYSTQEAFKAIARYSRPGGCLYVWVYGPQSIKENSLRRLAYLVESATRPILSKRPSSLLSTVFLSLVALGYLAFNAIHRLCSPNTQKYNFERALHAARDRFTPRYAHRHNPKEVVGWFEQAGFEEIEVVDWRIMPPAEQETYRRNVGVRGKRK
jgi:SAM-dependent methyltransferase/uncharacterized protein YbaR (Trm112 family)